MNKTVDELSVWWNPSSMWYFKDSEWSHDPLPFNLEDVHEWYVRWNLLHVLHTADGEWVHYPPNICGTEDYDSYKLPHRVWLDGERAEEYEDSLC